MFHGNVYNRWFDKCFTSAVYANGVVGSNIEHSLLDATVNDALFIENCNITIFEIGLYAGMGIYASKRRI